MRLPHKSFLYRIQCHSESMPRIAKVCVLCEASSQITSVSMSPGSNSSCLKPLPRENISVCFVCVRADRFLIFSSVVIHPSSSMRLRRTFFWRLPSGLLSPALSRCLALSLSFARSGFSAFWCRVLFVLLGFIVCSFPALALLSLLSVALFLCGGSGCARASFCVLVVIFLCFFSLLDGLKV